MFENATMERTSVGVGEVTGVADDLARLVAGCDPAATPAGEVSLMWAEFDRVERLAAAAKRLFAARVDTVGEWRNAGCANAAEFMALRAGVTIGAARTVLETSRALDDCQLLADALRAGILSGVQADLIAEAAVVNPHAEEQLIERAPRQSNRELRDACGRAKARGDRDPEKRRRRIHRKRYLRWRTNTDGSFSISGTGTIEDGEQIIRVLQPRIDAAFAKHRNAKHHPDRDAYAWDALVALLGDDNAEVVNSGEPKRRAARSRALIRVDLSALRRNSMDPASDEVCEIAGLGPISLTRARGMLGDSILHLLITNGTDVVNVTHLGRNATLAQQLSLIWANGTSTCAIDGCQRTRLEIDHNDPWADVQSPNSPTSPRSAATTTTSRPTKTSRSSPTPPSAPSDASPQMTRCIPTTATDPHRRLLPQLASPTVS